MDFVFVISESRFICNRENLFYNSYMPTIKVKDIMMYYEIHGKGEPVVLIGGLANDVTDYTRTTIVATLAKKYKVIIFDNRGAGRSDKPDIQYSITMMADDAAGLLEKLEIKKAYLIGVSMGGRIALDLTIRYPQLVKKLILVSTAARVVNTFRRVILLGLLARISGFGIFKSPYQQPRYAFLRQKKASSSYNGIALLHKIRVPTLIMQGKKDSLVPLRLAEELHNGIRNSQLLLFEGGHAFFFFKPEQFTDAVFAFLQSGK
jgi:pimeloyl-ACP methyl ester carboxylesterase